MLCSSKASDDPVSNNSNDATALCGPRVIVFAQPLSHHEYSNGLFRPSSVSRLQSCQVMKIHNRNIQVIIYNTIYYIEHIQQDIMKPLLFAVLLSFTHDHWWGFGINFSVFLVFHTTLQSHPRNLRGPPQCHPRPRNKSLRDYEPLVSFNKALLGPCLFFWGGGGGGGIGTLLLLKFPKHLESLTNLLKLHMAELRTPTLLLCLVFGHQVHRAFHLLSKCTIPLCERQPLGNITPQFWTDPIPVPDKTGRAAVQSTVNWRFGLVIWVFPIILLFWTTV